MPVMPGLLVRTDSPRRVFSLSRCPCQSHKELNVSNLRLIVTNATFLVTLLALLFAPTVALAEGRGNGQGGGANGGGQANAPGQQAQPSGDGHGAGGHDASPNGQGSGGAPNG